MACRFQPVSELVEKGEEKIFKGLNDNFGSYE